MSARAVRASGWTDDDVAKVTFNAVCGAGWRNRRLPKPKNATTWKMWHAAWLSFLDVCATTQPGSPLRETARQRLQRATEWLGWTPD